MENQIEVKIVADSVSETGARITTFECSYHRFFHSEMMTHRVFSRNAASSRAIPTVKLVEIVKSAPMLPVSLGANKPGMQADEKQIDDSELFIEDWKKLGISIAEKVSDMTKYGAHKQIINRPLEAFLPIKIVLTSTEWNNFFELRDSEFAQPEFHQLAKMMKLELSRSSPRELQEDEWHLPYITEDDLRYVSENTSEYEEYSKMLCEISASRCARVSHAIGGLSKKSIEEEIKKGRELVSLKHMSPFEHIATPWDVTDKYYKDIATITSLTDYLSTPDSVCPAWADVRNFRGWRQLRSFIEHNEYQ